MSYIRILIVEDERITAMETQGQLLMFGYDVLPLAFSGKDAIQKSEEFRPDLVLMDIKLKGDMDGIEAAEYIHSRLGIPIVYMTAFADEKTLQRAKKTQPYGYLIKPFKMEELQSTIEMALYKHKMEEKLRESEEKFRTIFDNARDGILLADFETKKFALGNNMICKMLGYDQDEIKNLGIEDIHPKESLTFVIRQFESQMAREIELAKEIPMKRKDGSVFYADVNSSPITISEKTYFMGVFRDITGRMSVEEELRKLVAQASLIHDVGKRISSELKIESLLSEIVNAVQEAFQYYCVTFLLIDEDAQCLTLQSNAGAYTDVFKGAYSIPLGEGMTGQAAETGQIQVSGDVSKNPYYVSIESEVTKSELAVPIKCRQKKVMGVLDIQSDELESFDDTDIAAMEILSTQIGSAIENARLYEQAQREITERKLLESQLVQSQKLESIGQLAAGIAHEINTPTQYVGDNTHFIQESFVDIQKILEKTILLLSSMESGSDIQGHVDELRQMIDEADLDYLLGEIPTAIKQSLEGIDRITHIVGAMKEFAHPSKKEKTPVDINKAIETTITIARNEWKYVADMQTDFDYGIPPVMCIPDEFNQVILNMITNAAHAIGKVVGDGSNGKGSIKISTHHEGNWAEVRISDTGIGIPVSIRNKIFDPFFTTKEIGKGTGQGLAISHSVIIEKHGGSITFETEEGKGTTFIIKIPI